MAVGGGGYQGRTSGGGGAVSAQRTDGDRYLLAACLACWALTAGAGWVLLMWGM